MIWDKIFFAIGIAGACFINFQFGSLYGQDKGMERGLEKGFDAGWDAGYKLAMETYSDWKKGFHEGFYACRDHMIQNKAGNFNEVKEADDEH